MALVKLPKELLLMVTDHLPLRSIECLALTLNKHITPVILPKLKPLFAQRKHVKAMETRFDDKLSFNGDPAFLDDPPVDLIESNRDKLHIPPDAKIVEPTEMQRLERLEYLNLKEDLHWLQPLDPGTEEQMEPHDTHAILTPKELADLEKDAKSVNIVLPPSFLKLMGDPKLPRRVPSTTANYFRVSGGLRKVPKAVDGGAGGYSISMYSDQQGCGYWDLYLVPGEEGAHCVLSDPYDSGYTPSDISDDDEAEAEEDEKDPGRAMARIDKGDVHLCGASFEQWLALTYFEQWMCFVLLYNDGGPTEALEEYVRHMYVQD